MDAAITSIGRWSSADPTACPCIEIAEVADKVPSRDGDESSLKIEWPCLEGLQMLVYRSRYISHTSAKSGIFYFHRFIQSPKIQDPFPCTKLQRTSPNPQDHRKHPKPPSASKSRASQYLNTQSTTHRNLSKARPTIISPPTTTKPSLPSQQTTPPSSPSTMYVPLLALRRPSPFLPCALTLNTYLTHTRRQSLHWFTGLCSRRPPLRLSDDRLTVPRMFSFRVRYRSRSLVRGRQHRWVEGPKGMELAGWGSSHWGRDG